MLQPLDLPSSSSSIGQTRTRKMIRTLTRDYERTGPSQCVLHLGVPVDNTHASNLQPCSLIPRPTHSHYILLYYTVACAVVIVIYQQSHPASCVCTVCRAKRGEQKKHHGLRRALAPIPLAPIPIPGSPSQPQQLSDRVGIVDMLRSSFPYRESKNRSANTADRSRRPNRTFFLVAQAPVKGA